MTNTEKKILNIFITVFFIILILAIILFLNKDKIIRKNKFVAPVMETNVIEGTPENIDEDLDYQEMPVKDDYIVYLSSTPKIKDNKLILYFTSSNKNNDLLKIRVLDKDDNILAESGLIKPNSYIKELGLNEELKDGDGITIKVMSYVKETFYSNGSFKLNVFVHKESSNLD